MIGAGPIGLGTMEFARIAGATVIALDIDNERLLVCKDRLNFVNTINATAPDVSQQLMTLTNGDMPNVIIDATGNLNALNIWPMVEGIFWWACKKVTYLLVTRNFIKWKQR